MKIRSKGKWWWLEELQPRDLGRFAILKLKLHWSCGLRGKRQDLNQSLSHWSKPRQRGFIQPWDLRRMPLNSAIAGLKNSRTNMALHIMSGMVRLAQSISPMLMMNESKCRRFLILMMSSMPTKPASSGSLCKTMACQQKGSLAKN